MNLCIEDEDKRYNNSIHIIWWLVCLGGNGVGYRWLQNVFVYLL